MARLLSGVLIVVLSFWWSAMASAQVVQAPPNTPPSPLSSPAPGTPSWPAWHPWNPFHPNFQDSNNMYRRGFLNAIYGQVVGYIEVLPQQVVVPVYVPGPESFSGQYQGGVVEIPGYFVMETTTGYLYPERWSLEQPSPGVYVWRVLPWLFTRK